MSETVFDVRREMGGMGKVSAVWACFPDDGAAPPVARDLLFLGKTGQDVTVLTSVAGQGLPGTGTNVFSFSGAKNSNVTVAALDQLSSNDIRSAFGISGCIKISVTQTLVLVTKTAADRNDSIHCYTMSIEATPLKTSFIFTYSTDKLKVNRCVTASVPDR